MTETESEAGGRPGRPAQQPGESDIRYNFRLLLIHGMLGQTGFRLLQAPTFLPAYLSLLAGNNAVVGIARAVQSLGMSISPYLAAWMVEHRLRVKRLGILFGSLMRFQILLLALTALLLPRDQALVAVWIVIGLWGFSSGLQMVTFSFLLSKVIPAHRRGRLVGIRNATAGITLLVVSALGGWLIEHFGFPRGYGWTFLLAFVLTTLGLGAFFFIREPDTLGRRQPARLLSRMAQLPALLRAEPDFARFVIARLLATAGRGALPFYVLFLGQRFELSGTRLALLTILYTLAESQGALLWGILSERTGFRWIFLGSLATWSAGNLLILQSQSLGSAYLVFVLVGAGFSGFMLASQNLVLEFGSETDRPMRIAATHATSELVGMVSYLGAAAVSEMAPLAWIFWISLFLHTTSAAVMFKLKDPRHASAERGR